MPIYEMPGPKVIEKYLSNDKDRLAKGEAEHQSIDYWKQCGFFEACVFFFGEVYAGRLIMDSDLAMEEDPNATH